MPIFSGEKYRARIARSDHDVMRCQRLRYLAFVEHRGLSPEESRLDRDDFDDLCRHIMVEDIGSGTVVCCFRVLPLRNGSEIPHCYSARHYNLARLESFPGRMVEMGRFCVHPAFRDPAIIRLAWTAMGDFIEAEGVEFIFGCSSFEGVDADVYRDAFALLAEKHLAPRRWLPRVKAPRVFRFARQFRLWRARADRKTAVRHMPPLLRLYLGMGAWVSDHAVIDNELNTLHVFTGVEVSHLAQRSIRLLHRSQTA